MLSLLGVPREQHEVTTAQLRKKMRTLSKRNERQEKKIKDLSDLVSTLTSANLIEREPAEILSTCFDSNILEIIKSELVNQNRSKNRREYNEVVKQFALTLYYYSPQAYDYCRNIFILPHISTLRSWLSNINCEPGFLSDVITVVSKLQSKDFCLIIDSMAIHKQSSYDNGKYVGFCNYGGLVAEGCDALASEALVFLLVPLHGPTRQYPIGYFLVDKIKSNIQAQLITTALHITAEKGIVVHAVTGDGCAANLSTFNLLGCNIDLDRPVFHFTHPVLNSKVYCTLDACHMLKLARNALAELGELRTQDGEVISWSYIKKLVELQESTGLHLATKVNSQHVNFHKAKMKVKLSAQVFSRSVADALMFLQTSRFPGFTDCMPTVEFIRKVKLSHWIIIMKYCILCYLCGRNADPTAPMVLYSLNALDGLL